MMKEKGATTQDPATVGRSETSAGVGEDRPREVLMDPRVAINSFPKSGTHLVEQMIQVIVDPMPADKPWYGSFNDHSWTTNWAPTRRIFRRLGLIVDGTYAKGHCGFSREIEMFAWGSRIAMLFVYRDPRDVAVSLLYHILDRHGSHSHPEWYEELGRDKALLAVIRGMSRWDYERKKKVTYQGVMERWNQYAGWLKVNWVEKFTYERLMEDRAGEAERMIRYVMNFCANARGYEVQEYVDGCFDEAVRNMVANSSRGDSQTFRKGITGEWRHEFKPMHVKAFKNEDRRWARKAGVQEGSWLVHLGYEKDKDWGV